MTLDPELEGLWRSESEISDGRKEPLEPWHYLFRNGLHKEIVPDFVGTGCSYDTDVSANPRRLTITLDHNGPDGPPDPNPTILRGVYEVDGNELRITYGVDDEYPDAVTDKFPYSIRTLIRHTGPIPESRKPSGTPPITHDLLGQLDWDDNLRWYEGKIQLGGRKVRLALTPDDVNDIDSVIERATAIVGNCGHYVRLVTEYAVEGLLDLKNDSWRDAGQSPVTDAVFMESMTLESITVYGDGRADFWHHDGGLFLGHSIQVSIDPNDRCTLTDIPG
jgi:hypothetical protein